MASQHTIADPRPPKDKPKIIGLYGIPGCGKTFLLNELKSLNRGCNFDYFDYYEGSEMIADLVPGGLQAFQDMKDEQKLYWRKRAIDTISKKCASRLTVGIVTGHFMFWPEDQEDGQEVYTENDLATFTHIIYIDTPADVLEDGLRIETLGDQRRGEPIDGFVQ